MALPYFSSCTYWKATKNNLYRSRCCNGKAIEVVFTESYHGLCTFHVMQNDVKHQSPTKGEEKDEGEQKYGGEEK
jgi:hypothetical protein